MVKNSNYIKYKAEQLKVKFKTRFRNFTYWCSRNKEVIITLAPIVISGTIALVKVISRHNNNRKSQELHDLYCYDRSLGHYWKLRRELTNKEWLEIDLRRKNGERLADILDSLKVLK